MNFQFGPWHWFWHDKIEEPVLITTIYSHYAGFGPFQFHWYSYH